MLRLSAMNSLCLPLHADSLSITLALECINCLNSTLPSTISQSLLSKWLSHLYCIELLWLTLCFVWTQGAAHTHTHTRSKAICGAVCTGCLFFSFFFHATRNTRVYVSKQCLLQSEISSRSYRGYVGNLGSTNT